MESEGNLETEPNENTYNNFAINDDDSLDTDQITSRAFSTVG